MPASLARMTSAFDLDIPLRQRSCVQRLRAVKVVKSGAAVEGKTAGIQPGTSTALKERLQEGFTFVGLCTDIRFLSTAAKAAVSEVKADRHPSVLICCKFIFPRELADRELHVSARLDDSSRLVAPVFSKNKPS